MVVAHQEDEVDPLDAVDHEAVSEEAASEEAAVEEEEVSQEADVVAAALEDVDEEATEFIVSDPVTTRNR